MPTNPRQSELGALFDQRKYQGVLEIAKADEITPASDPQAANVVAASLFQLGRFPECLLWCEGLHPALQGEPSFSSMYGAAQAFDLMMQKKYSAKPYLSMVTTSFAK